MQLAPIVLFVYNRLDHTRETVQALVGNKYASESILYIFSDAAKSNNFDKDVENVRIYIRSIKGFKAVHIVNREENYGLARNVISGVTEVLKKHSSIIVLEDDIVTSPFFLKYMNEGLEFYKNIKRVGSISGFSFSKDTMSVPTNYNKDIFFSLRPSSWGWATWRDRWDKIDWEVRDFDNFKLNFIEQYRFNRGGADLSNMLIAQKKGVVDSWAIRWAYSFYKQGLVSVYPVVSFVDNIGSDNSGVHSKTSNKELYANKRLNKSPNIKFIGRIEFNKEILNSFRKVYSKNFHYYLRKLLYKLGLKL